MSKIIDIAGAQTAINLKVQQAVAFLIFDCSFPDASAADWPTLFTRMNAIIVNGTLQSKTAGEQTIIPKVPLGVLAEISAAHGGQINVVDNGTDHSVRFKLPVGSGGALQLSSDTTLVLDVTGSVANDNVDVYAGDLPIGTSIAENISRLAFNENAATTIPLTNAHTIHLPVAQFEKIEVTYRGGKVVTLVGEEIKAWVLEGNGQQGNLNGAVTDGYIQYYSLHVVDAVSAKVTLTANVNGYLGTLANPI